MDKLLSKENTFFLNFCWTHAHLWGHWYPCFGLLVTTSPLGFKARVGSTLFAFGGGLHNIHSLRFTSGATPLPVYNASIAASHLPHMRVSAEVGCWDLNCRPPARQSDALPTRPRRPALRENTFCFCVRWVQIDQRHVFGQYMTGNNYRYAPLILMYKSGRSACTCI